MKKFKIRASQAGKILKNARSKTTMGETAKNYIKEWYISELTGKEKEIKSKYLSRGNAMEEHAIKRIAKYYNTDVKKNEIYLENEYFCGTYDCDDKDRVIDAKVPFDCFTFPFFSDIIDPLYYAQLQVYMNLTGKRKASLCYCLENGSYEQINKLAWSKSNGEEPTIENWDEAEKELNYDHLPDELRIKVLEFDYDEALIENLKTRVLEARKYIETDLLTKLKKNG